MTEHEFWDALTENDTDSRIKTFGLANFLENMNGNDFRRIGGTCVDFVQSGIPRAPLSTEWSPEIYAGLLLRLTARAAYDAPDVTGFRVRQILSVYNHISPVCMEPITPQQLFSMLLTARDLLQASSQSDADIYPELSKCIDDMLLGLACDLCCMKYDAANFYNESQDQGMVLFETWGDELPLQHLFLDIDFFGYIAGTFIMDKTLLATREDAHLLQLILSDHAVIDFPEKNFRRPLLKVKQLPRESEKLTLIMADAQKAGIGEFKRMNRANLLPVMQIYQKEKDKTVRA